MGGLFLSVGLALKSSAAFFNSRKLNGLIGRVFFSFYGSCFLFACAYLSQSAFWLGITTAMLIRNIINIKKLVALVKMAATFKKD